MSIKTIHCRLTAPEPVRRHLWHLMCEKNTPLINDLLKAVSQHPEFENWQRQSSVPLKTVRDLCKPLRVKYPGQPGRFYDSACLMVSYTYESWLAIQQKLRRRLDGKERWLNTAKSDTELCELCSETLEVLQGQARRILNHLSAASEQISTSKKSSHHKKRQKGSSTHASDLLGCLFDAYEEADDLLHRYAIAYLIKTGGEIPEAEEDPEKFAHRIHRKQEEIERLEAQLQARLPKGRDLTGEEFMEALAIATQTIPESVIQQQEWQARLLTRPALLPYPIIYGSSVDIRWGKTAKNRLTVSFNGIDKYLKGADPDIQEWLKSTKENPFRLYCDQRQLPFFQRFFDDWQAYGEHKDTYPAGLLTLSSAMLAWRKGDGKGNPWNVHHLALYCSFDTRLMTAEGTLDVQREKLAKVQTVLPLEVSKQEFTENQQKFHQRSISTLERLKNVPTRPSRKPYIGNPEILVGLSVGLSNPVTAAVVNGKTGEVLTYRTPQTLLGERYRLLNKHRQKQRQNALQRHKNQKQGITFQPSESELGEYVDRLLAKAIIDLAQKYRAASIVVPTLTNLRELLASEITAKAEQACPGSVQAQDRYAKEYRQTIHQWSYSRLIEAVCSKAQQLGITVESGFQHKGNSPQNKARDLAIAAYYSRAAIKN